MAHILQTNTPPQYIPVFRVELLDELFDDADAEMQDVARIWAGYEEREAA